MTLVARGKRFLDRLTARKEQSARVARDDEAAVPVLVRDAVNEVRALDGKVAAIDVFASAGYNTSVAIHNDTNRILTELSNLSARFDDLTRMLERMDRVQWLEQRANSVMRATVIGGESDFGLSRGPVLPSAATDLAAQIEQLRNAAPVNFAAWKQRFDAGEAEYQKRLPTSLSTSDHLDAACFRSFLAIHARGRVLDLGCGPLAKPSYLCDIPNDRLAAIDPLLPFEPHPFAFRQSFAEFLPWPDGSFDTVVCGTSIDHVYLLDQAFEEVRRVLSTDGKFVLWAGIFPHTEPYDPYGQPIAAPDEFHLFHAGENWFIEFASRYFRLEERFNLSTVGYANSFMLFSKG